MSQLPDPIHFAKSWIEAWNARDVEGVLVHFADDVVFTSPTALRVVPESGGTVHGKEALRDYWTRALRINPAIHFTLIDTFAGINTIVIHFRDQAGVFSSEVMVFRDGLVAFGHATRRQQDRL